jgi:endoglycosylceramidase
MRIRNLALLALVAACSSKPDAKLPPEQLGWVRVENGRLRDEFGRELLLRGINARVEGLFDVTFDDGREPLEPIPAFTEDDARQMAAMGFNFLRLPINWSGLEPEQGGFSRTYLERLHQVVDWCRDAGLYVLIDFHQDAYSKEIGEDGAPRWAIVPQPETLMGGPLTDLDQRRLSGQVRDAFQGFFENRKDAQVRFMPAWRLIITEFKDEPHVIGFEPMNEPVTFQFDSSGALLFGFYQRVVHELRDIDTRHTLWLEPDSSRNITLEAPLRDAVFPDGNVVYEPHLYPMIVKPEDNTADAWASVLQPTFDAMVEEAKSWGSALVIGEWGGDPKSPESIPYFDAVHRLADERTFGHALWLWKENSQGSWGLFDYDEKANTWTERTEGRRQLTRPYALNVPGTLVSHSFDPKSATLRVKFKTAGGEAGPVLHLPPDWIATAHVTLNGKGIDVTRTGSRAPVAWDGSAGEFELVVTP